MGAIGDEVTRLDRIEPEVVAVLLEQLPAAYWQADEALSELLSPYR